MRKTIKWVFCLELIFFALPVYLLAVSCGFLSLGGAVIGNTIGNRLLETVTLLFIFLSLWVFAKLSYELLFKINKSSVLYSPWYWRCVYTVLVYTLVGSAISIWLQGIHWSLEQAPGNIEFHIYLALYSSFRWALFGMPMLIPGFHLIVMKYKYLPTVESSNGNS